MDGCRVSLKRSPSNASYTIHTEDIKMIIIIMFLVQGLLVAVTRADQWYQPSLARALSASQPLTVVEENDGYGSKRSKGQALSRSDRIGGRCLSGSAFFY